MITVAFDVYDVDRDGFISNGELFLVLKMMVGSNLKVRLSNSPQASSIFLTQVCPNQDQQLQQIVDKTIMEADKDGDGKLSFEEFAQTVSNTVRKIYIKGSNLLIYPRYPGYCQTNDTRRSFLTKLQDYYR